MRSRRTPSPLRTIFLRLPLPAAGIALAGLLLSLLFYCPVEAREDSATLVFEKTSAPVRTMTYVVKKGDSFAAILRKQRGEEKKRIPYDLIRQLNPGIKDLNRIYPGQQIVLPVRESEETGKSPKNLAQTSESPPSRYRIKKEDSISRILLSELDVSPEDILPTYRSIRELNPDIDDMIHLPAGEILTLPSKPLRQDQAPSTAPLPPAAHPAESQPIETVMITPPNVEHVLGFIRPVIHRMNGTLNSRGNYFIPLKEAAQITIDCSLIPVVELDDGATVLLDFGNRLSAGVKAMIGQSWRNYAVLPREELGDGLAGLKGIVRRSRNYAMTEVASPLTLLAQPEIRVFPDWMITAKKGAADAPYRQALFLLGSEEKPLPGEARSFLEKNGLVVTEITGERALSGPAAPRPTPALIDLSGLNGVALAEQLLKALGETPAAGVEVVVFDQARSGFTLSIKADLLLKKGDQRWIIHTKGLPDEFVRVLKEERTEVIPFGEGASRRSLIDGLLLGLRIPASFGHFSFRVSGSGNRPRLALTFPALRVSAEGKPLYLFDFNLSAEVLALLDSLLGGRIAKY